MELLTWTPDETRPSGLRLVWVPALTCPKCGTACGALYDAQGDGEEVCLSCAIDAELVADYERTEQDAFWGAAETACCSCGID